MLCFMGIKHGFIVETFLAEITIVQIDSSVFRLMISQAYFSFKCLATMLTGKYTTLMFSHVCFEIPRIIKTPSTLLTVMAKFSRV